MLFLLAIYYHGQCILQVRASDAVNAICAAHQESASAMLAPRQSKTRPHSTHTDPTARALPSSVSPRIDDAQHRGMQGTHIAQGAGIEAPGATAQRAGNEGAVMHEHEHEQDSVASTPAHSNEAHRVLAEACARPHTNTTGRRAMRGGRGCHRKLKWSTRGMRGRQRALDETTGTAGRRGAGARCTCTLKCVCPGCWARGRAPGGWQWRQLLAPKDENRRLTAQRARTQSARETHGGTAGSAVLHTAGT